MAPKACPKIGAWGIGAMVKDETLFGFSYEGLGFHMMT